MISTLTMQRSYAALVIFAVLWVIYLVFSQKPFIYPYFWRTYWYTIVCAIPLSWSIIMLPHTNNSFTIMLGWALIVLFGIILIMVALSANLNPEKFKEKLNSRNISLLIAGFIGFEMFIVMIVQLWDRIFK
jgi:hypothetical protein